MIELNAEDIELIIRYVEGGLSESERQVVQQRLTHDARLQASLDAYKQAKYATLVTQEDRIQAILKEEQAQLETATIIPLAEKKPFSYYILGGGLLAASLAALVWFAAPYLFDNNKTKSKLSPLVASYFEPYPALGIHRGNEAEDVTSQALKDYALNDFQNAIPLLEKSFQLKKDSLFLFYKGIAYLGNGQTTEAHAVLSTLQTSEILPLESVKWYLALAYIELGEKEKALVLLQDVANTEGELKEKALDILEKLKT